MSRTRVCLPDFGSDIALTLMLKSWELKSWLFLLDFASAGRDPWIIPASKMGRLRLAMRLGRDEEKFQKRLSVFAGDADLIDLRPDGSIFIKYLEEQDYLDRRDAGDDEEDYDLPGAGPAERNGNGSGNGNGYGVRQPNHRYSMERSAVIKREQREARRRQQQNNGQNNGQNGNGQNGLKNESVPESVHQFESKCPAPNAQFVPEMSPAVSRQMSPNQQDMSGTSLTRVSPNVNVSGKDDYEIISESGDVHNVADKKVSSPMSSSVHAPSVPPSPASRVPLRPGFEEVDARVQRNKDVEAVIRLTRDGKSRGFYINVWKHCLAHNCFPVWDMAQEILADKISTQAKNGPPPGHPDHFPQSAYGASLNKILMNLLRDNGTPYQEGTATERAEAQQEIRASLAGSAPAPPPAGSGGLPPGVTPLDDLYPEMESDEETEDE